MLDRDTIQSLVIIAAIVGGPLLAALICVPCILMVMRIRQRWAEEASRPKLPECPRCTARLKQVEVNTISGKGESFDPDDPPDYYCPWCGDGDSNPYYFRRVRRVDCPADANGVPAEKERIEEV